MATYSMLKELSHRREWLARFNEVVKAQSSDPHYRAAWPAVRDLYEEGYNAEQAAVKHLQRLHLLYD